MILIQDKFTIEENGISFTDAIVLPKEEYDSYTQEQIEQMKVDRFNAHKQLLIDSQNQEAPLPEEVIEQIDDQISGLQEQIENLNDQKKYLQDNLEVNNG